MLGWSTVLIVLLLATAVFGFTEVARPLKTIGRLLFLPLLVLWLVTLFLGRRPPPTLLSMNVERDQSDEARG